MPGWHEFTKSFRADKKLVVLGVIQEQHPQRCELFAQWKKFDWPIVQDPLNRIPTRAVPVTIAIDEHGVVRSTRPRPNSFVSSFLEKEFSAPEHAAKAIPNVKPDLRELQAKAAGENSYLGWRELGDALVLWRDDKHTEAIAAYQQALKHDPKDAAVWFRLGVAHRRRYESAKRKPDDFKAAVDAWGAALEEDPNHYIFRRRIQQYGPRLIKPYPFYDWVEQAREEIRKRGDEPVRLAIDPSGAEIAAPSRSFASADDNVKSPDPKGRIDRDRDWVSIKSVVVPNRAAPGKAVRVHVDLRPNQLAHWNNEAEPLIAWIESADGVVLQRQKLVADQPRAAESTEPRRLEFEVRVGEDQTKDIELRGYALYYICEEAGGTCLYRRQDFTVPIRVAK